MIQKIVKEIHIHDRQTHKTKRIVMKNGIPVHDVEKFRKEMESKFNKLTLESHFIEIFLHIIDKH